MINKNMKKVLVALRSGEFTQTVAKLQDSSGHCCLGVMCEVYEKETGDELPRDQSDFLVGNNLNDHQNALLWLGLSSPQGHNEVGSSLICRNDFNRNTFLEIADFIESEPKGLLV
jgi:hypothetical protein